MENDMRAIFMHEGAGVYTKGAKTKEEAVDIMRKEVEQEKKAYGKSWGDHHAFNPEDITLESVKETRYYQHRKCEVDSIGDDGDCYECGEMINGNGRLTFAYFA